MKNLLIYFLSFLLIFHLYSFKAFSLENESIPNKSQLRIANKYAISFCSAKDNNFFEGLDNEKTLKFSYFKYIGFKNKEIYTKEMYKPLIIKIKEKCIITNKEEQEINDFFKMKLTHGLKNIS
tara:strand:- start:188 stop:556 length:369 start_codon:yes stop_codon:yes gene_type:complete